MSGGYESLFVLPLPATIACAGGQNPGGAIVAIGGRIASAGDNGLFLNSDHDGEVAIPFANIEYVEIYPGSKPGTAPDFSTETPLGPEAAGFELKVQGSVTLRTRYDFGRAAWNTIDGDVVNVGTVGLVLEHGPQDHWGVRSMRFYPWAGITQILLRPYHKS